MSTTEYNPEYVVRQLMHNHPGMTELEARRIRDLTPPASLAVLSQQASDRLEAEEEARKALAHANSPAGRAEASLARAALEEENRKLAVGARLLLQDQPQAGYTIEGIAQMSDIEVLVATGIRPQPVVKREPRIPSRFVGDKRPTLRPEHGDTPEMIESVRANLDAIEAANQKRTAARGGQ